MRSRVETEAELTLQRAVQYPLPGMNAPTAVAFSPDSRLVTYLWSASRSLTQELWAYDLDAGAARMLAHAPDAHDGDTALSHDEALRRERQRMRSTGITSYAWAEHRNVLLVPFFSQAYTVDLDGDGLRHLETEGEAVDPRLNPAGDAIAYIHEGDLWTLALGERAHPLRLTYGASEPDATGERVVTNGLAEFIAQEEMARSSGFWWSRDGSKLAFEQVDRSPVPPYSIVDQGSARVSVETHRYPFAGGANVRVRLGVVDADGGPVRWLPLDGDDMYLARVDWAPDGSIMAQVESRDQRHLNLLRIDIEEGSVRCLWSEADETWINLHDDLRFLPSNSGSPDDYRILWSSERTGYRHIYLYSRDGDLIRELTGGNWAVDAVVGQHEGWVYFLAGKDSPLERKLYRVDLEGRQFECLTPEPGFHNAVVAPSGAVLAHTWSTTGQPPSLDVLYSGGTPGPVIFKGDDQEAQALALRAPEFITVQADDGTALYGAAYRPPDSLDGPHPILVSVYGGPHVQQVNNSWGMTADLRAQYLARQGYLVWKLDNRGSARRGHAFESAISRRLGDLEVQDQVAGVQALAKTLHGDMSRVGVYGWSYGGYMAIMCLLRASKTFKAAVAGAPVTAWDGYDTHYTERYMGLPSSNVDGYRDSSAMQHVGSLSGRLLLVHGMMDENVHFRHTARLVSALLAEGKPFELLPFPNERHMPRSEQGRLYMEERVIDHFRRALQR